MNGAIKPPILDHAQQSPVANDRTWITGDPAEILIPLGYASGVYTQRMVKTPREEAREMKSRVVVRSLGRESIKGRKAAADAAIPSAMESLRPRVSIAMREIATPGTSASCTPKRLGNLSI